MSAGLEELEVLRRAETLADGVWEVVKGWKGFDRDTVGLQLVRAADSIGANIAEAYGRFHYGDKLQFLYYARGSLFETKYWLNRAQWRGLISHDRASEYRSELTSVARQLNAFAASLKRQRNDTNRRHLKESDTDYGAEGPVSLISQSEIAWLSDGVVQSEPNASISNL